METFAMPSLLVITMLVTNALKTSFKNNKKVLQLMPIIALAVGGIMGMLAFLAMPDLVGAENFAQAFIEGMIAGASAVGTMQIAGNIKTMNSEKKAAIKPVQPPETPQQETVNALLTLPTEISVVNATPADTKTLPPSD